MDTSLNCESSQRPDYVPAKRPWCWVVDGLERRVAAWIDTSVKGLYVVLGGPDKPWPPYIWRPDNDVADWQSNKSPVLTPAAAAQCRVLYERCVFDEGGQYWECLWLNGEPYLTDLERHTRIHLRRRDAFRMARIHDRDQCYKIQDFLERGPLRQGIPRPRLKGDEIKPVGT